AHNIQNILKNLSTSRTSSKAHYIGHLQYIHQNYNVLHTYYGAKRFRQIKFDNYVGKQKALSIICRKIIGNKKDHYSNSVVIAYGAGSFSSSSRGHASGPIKQLFAELKRRCCTRLVSEFRTSQICSQCKDRFTYPQRYYALKVCRSNCLTLWNRD
ncbi:9018_t:CDS:2, partial [Funneliformis geosporum]